MSNHISSLDEEGLAQASRGGPLGARMYGKPFVLRPRVGGSQPSLAGSKMSELCFLHRGGKGKKNAIFPHF